MVTLTQEALKKLLKYDPETGVFTWIKGKPGKSIGTIAGHKRKDGYVNTGINNKLYLNHRLAWLYVYGEFPKYELDHINGVKDDNRICNLRDIPHAMNIQNQNKAHKDSKTGFLGVSFNPVINAYTSQIVINGKFHQIGKFATAEEASEAYKTAKSIHHEGVVNG